MKKLIISTSVSLSIALGMCGFAFAGDVLPLAAPVQYSSPGNNSSAASNRGQVNWGPVQKLLHRIPSTLVVKKSWLKELGPVDPMVRFAYGPTKTRVVEAQVIMGAIGRIVHLAYLPSLPEEEAERIAVLERQVREVLLAHNDLGEHVVRCLGAIIKGEGEDAYIEAMVFEETARVDHLLEVVITRKDIDVLSAMPFFIRQLFAACARAQQAGVLFRNIDASRVVIMRRASDNSLAARIMDTSTMCSVLDKVETRRPFASAWEPELQPGTFADTARGRASTATDVLAVGKIAAKALLCSVHFGALARSDYAALIARGPDAVREALLAVRVTSVNNGLPEAAIATMRSEPARRISPSAAIAKLGPGNSLIAVAKKNLSQSSIERRVVNGPSFWRYAEIALATKCFPQIAGSGTIAGAKPPNANQNARVPPRYNNWINLRE